MKRKSPTNPLRAARRSRAIEEKTAECIGVSLTLP